MERQQFLLIFWILYLYLSVAVNIVSFTCPSLHFFSFLVKLHHDIMFIDVLLFGFQDNIQRNIILFK